MVLGSHGGRSLYIGALGKSSLRGVVQGICPVRPHLYCVPEYVCLFMLYCLGGVVGRMGVCNVQVVGFIQLWFVFVRLFLFVFLNL